MPLKPYHLETVIGNKQSLLYPVSGVLVFAVDLDVPLNTTYRAIHVLDMNDIRLIASTLRPDDPPLPSTLLLRFGVCKVEANLLTLRFDLTINETFTTQLVRHFARTEKLDNLFLDMSENF